MTLNEAEMLIIQAQRAKAEADKLEAESYEAQQVKKAIEETKKYIDDDVKEFNKQYEATKRYYNDIKAETSNVTLDEEEKTITKKPYYYKRNILDDLECIELEPITATFKFATLKVMGYEINVSRHTVYDSIWSSRPKSNDFEMQIYHLYNNKWYKKAKTIVTKITDIKAEANAKKQKANARDTAKQDAYNDITKQYPDAQIKLSTDYYRNHKNEYTDWDVLDIQFNGNQIQYRIYANVLAGDDSKTYRLSLTKMIPADTSIESVMCQTGYNGCVRETV